MDKQQSQLITVTFQEGPLGVTLRRRSEDGVVFVHDIVEDSQAVNMDINIDDELWAIGQSEIGDVALDKDAWKELVESIRLSPRPLKAVWKRYDNDTEDSVYLNEVGEDMLPEQNENSSDEKITENLREPSCQIENSTFTSKTIGNAVSKIPPPKPPKSLKPTSLSQPASTSSDPTSSSSKTSSPTSISQPASVFSDPTSLPSKTSPPRPPQDLLTEGSISHQDLLTKGSIPHLSVVTPSSNLPDSSSAKTSPPRPPQESLAKGSITHLSVATPSSDLPDSTSDLAVADLSSRLVLKDKEKPSFANGFIAHSKKLIDNSINLVKDGRHIVRIGELEITSKASLAIFDKQNKRKFILLTDMLIVAIPSGNQLHVENMIDLQVCFVDVF
jgi:hypothetical protein